MTTIRQAPADLSGMRTPDAVVIEPLDVADRAGLATIAAIDREVSPRPWTVPMLVDEVSRSDRRWFVARTGEVDGRDGDSNRAIVGFAGLALLAGEAHVMTVAVAPDWQRRGIGSRLLEALLDAAERVEASEVTLEVRASNSRARELYRRAGFVETGIRPGYYPAAAGQSPGADREDAVIAWRR